METVAQPMAISDDALKLLVAEHGVRGTARLLGMDETQMNTFRKRVARAGWMQEPAIAAIRAKASPSVTAAPIVSRVSPTQAVAAEIASLGSKTRLSLARGIAKAGEHVETMQGPAILEDAQNIKAIAQTADLVHGWKDASPQVKIRLDVLSGNADAAPIDIEATEIQDVTETVMELCEPDPLDEY